MKLKASFLSAISIIFVILILHLGSIYSPHSEMVFAYPPPPTVIAQGFSHRVYLPLASNNNYPYPPNPTTSIYIQYNDIDRMYDLGYENGKNAANGLLILDFGNPRMINGVPGTKLLSSASVTTISDITNLTENFIGGYWNGYYFGGGSNINPDAFLTVGIGLNKVV